MMNDKIMKSLFTLILTLMTVLGFAQLRNTSVTSSGGAISSGGNYESIIVVGDPGASDEIAIGEDIELYAGFVPANFLGVQADSAVIQQDIDALIALYNSTNGSTWDVDTNWLNFDVPVSQWHGVGVEGDRVVSLNLSENGLTGFVTDSIRLLTGLVSLNLSRNGLTRDIPAGLGLMDALRFVNLSNNFLDGAIPDSLGLAVNLVRLNLADNELVGGFPASLTNMVALRRLLLDSNSLKGNLPDTIGKMRSLVEFNISDNQFQGVLPSTLAQLSAIRSFNISNNLFEDQMPAITSWPELRSFNVANNLLNGDLSFLQLSDSLSQINISENDFRQFPDLSGSSATLNQLNVSRNQLDFGSLEPNRNVSNFQFAPQDSLGVLSDTLIQRTSNLVLFDSVGGTSNIYQWIKDGSEITGATFESYNIAAATNNDDGSYVLRIENDLFPDFALYTQPTIVVVSSLERDLRSLQQLYLATNVDTTWINADGWSDNANILETPWFGVELNDDSTGVVGVSLSGNGLEGRVPRDIRFLANLRYLDLSDNAIEGFQDISRYDLDSLDLSGNQLSFADLLPNRFAVSNRTNFAYENQDLEIIDRDFLPTLRDTARVRAGNDIEVLARTPGRFNQYRWLFDPFFDQIPGEDTLGGQTNPFTVIEDIDYEKMGNYRIVVTNDSLPQLTLSDAVQVFAFDEVSGTVFTNQQGTALLTQGSVDLFRIQETGRFRFAGRSQVDAQGFYAVDSILLGDYILRATPGSNFFDAVTQTHYVDEYSWEDADTLDVRRKTEDINVLMLTNPGAAVADADQDPIATATGVVESDFEDIGDGRIDARRRVQKAACSLRRRSRGGRTQQDTDDYNLADFTELVAYTETNENGEFSFGAIPADVYRLDIQFPGIPMDESSQTFIEVVDKGSDDVNFDINATITEDGISVAFEEVLGRMRPYIKDAVLYPNPTDGVIKLDYNVSRKMGGLQARLIDLKGNVLLEQKLSHERGQQTMNMDMTELAAGVYLLKLINDDAEFTFSIRIVRQ